MSTSKKKRYQGPTRLERARDTFDTTIEHIAMLEGRIEKLEDQIAFERERLAKCRQRYVLTEYKISLLERGFEI